MKHQSGKHGIERLIATYVDAFQIPENVNYYAPEDFEKAQRHFIRFCLQQGPSSAPRRGMNQ